jgi:hypothetical protein
MGTPVTVRHALRSVLAVLLLGAAVVCALAAIDVLHWRSHVERASVALETSPRDRGIWEPRTLLPRAVSRGLLGLGDDVAFDRALQRYRILAARSGNLGGDRTAVSVARAGTELAQAELELERLGHGSLPAELRSRVQLLHSILLNQQLLLAGASAAFRLQRVADDIAAAIRTDPANGAAKYDLEQGLTLNAVLRRAVAADIPLKGSPTGTARGTGGSPGSLLGGGGF